MKEVALFLSLLLLAPLGEAAATNYRHEITLQPHLQTGYYCSANVSLNQGDIISVYVESVKGNAFDVVFHGPSGKNILFATPLAGGGPVFSKMYSAPVSGVYNIMIKNEYPEDNITVGYTVTKQYSWHHFLYRTEDIELIPYNGTEF